MPGIGAQLHTINPLLPDEHIQYIVSDAQDELIIVGERPAESRRRCNRSTESSKDEQFVGKVTPSRRRRLMPLPTSRHRRPADGVRLARAGGRPRCRPLLHVRHERETEGSRVHPADAVVAHDGDSLGSRIRPRVVDVVMPVVPMFHVNAWGFPFSTTAAGAKHVYPGPSPTPEDLATLIEEEGVTITAGVPTVWLGLMEYMAENDADLSSVERIIVGGSAAPEAMIRSSTTATWNSSTPGE